jgi:hypothetical protein
MDANGNGIVILAEALKPLCMALCEVADVLARGRETHSGDDWAQHPMDEHLEHARAHLEALARGDTSDRHLANAACRLLLALEVRDR